MYFSVKIQVTESYFKFLSYKLVAHQKTYSGSVVSELCLISNSQRELQQQNLGKCDNIHIFQII